MRTAGYKSTSPVHNIGSLVLYMAFLPIVHLTIKIARCLISSGLQEGASRTTRACFFLNKNLNLKTYVNFLAGYQIIFVTSALIYLLNTEKFTITVKETHRVKGKKTIQEMTYATFDFTFAVFLLAFVFALYLSLFIVTRLKGN